MKQNLFKVFAAFFFIQFTSILNAQELKKTQVLILGTMHLDQIKNVESKHVNRVLDSLIQFEFNVIGIEKMPVELLLDIQNRNLPHWQELFSYYGGAINKGEYYQDLYEMNFKKARYIIDSLSNKNPLTGIDRINLMKASLCSYDLWTASLHYQYISDTAVTDSTTLALMDNYVNSNNEINLIAINLAKKLKINKLQPIDNMQDESILLNDFPEFMKEYKESQEKIVTELFDMSFYKTIDSLQSVCVKHGDLYNIYKFINSEEYMQSDKKGQWDLWLKTNFKSKTDRSRYSLWEMRNLQIAANIMRLVAENPEQKIIIIIGSSHKYFLENYLKQMSDIELLKF